MAGEGSESKNARKKEREKLREAGLSHGEKGNANVSARKEKRDRY